MQDLQDFSDFSHDPSFFHAFSLFSQLETLRPPEPVLQQSIPKTGQFVDNSVDNVENPLATTVQKKDDQLSEESSALQRASEPLLRWQRDDAHLRRIQLFPRIFPGASWRFVADGPLPPHYEGLWTHAGERIRILAVRGAYAQQPPEGLSGFTRYLRADGAGYWVRLLSEGRT